MAFTTLKSSKHLTLGAIETPIIVFDQASLNVLSELIDNGYMGHFYTANSCSGVYFALQDYFNTSTTHKVTTQIPRDFPDYTEWKIKPKNPPALV